MLFINGRAAGQSTDALLYHTHFFGEILTYWTCVRTPRHPYNTRPGRRWQGELLPHCDRELRTDPQQTSCTPSLYHSRERLSSPEEIHKRGLIRGEAHLRHTAFCTLCAHRYATSYSHSLQNLQLYTQVSLHSSVFKIRIKPTP